MASRLVPESNQTSRMFCSRSKSRRPQAGHTRSAVMKSDRSRSYQASAPCSAKTPAVRSITAGSSIASWQALHRSAGIGTPHERCREIHQSGRVVSIPLIRSSPQRGNHSTSVMASSACRRRPLSEFRSASMAMNHCGVARKMTGRWQRQQCG